MIAFTNRLESPPMDLSSDLKDFLQSLRQSRLDSSTADPFALSASAAIPLTASSSAQLAGLRTQDHTDPGFIAPAPADPSKTEPDFIAPNLTDPASTDPGFAAPEQIAPNFSAPDLSASGDNAAGSAAAPQNLLALQSIPIDNDSEPPPIEARSRPQRYPDAAAIQERFQQTDFQSEVGSASLHPASEATSPFSQSSSNNLAEISRRLDDAATRMQKAFGTAKTVVLLRD
jgi:hypothetical protein